MKRFYCTYFDKAYLTRALALVDSLNTHEKNNFILFCVCMDEISRLTLDELNLPNVIAIPFHEIETKDYALLASKNGRTLVEYYWTATPTIILRILENNPQIDFLTYLDADLFFFSAPEPIFEEAEDYSIFIHKHNYSKELEHLSESCGKFNVGLLGFRRDQNAFSALRWWREKCIEWCYLRFEKDRMGDQKYLDYWPEIFQGVKVSDNPGVGLAPWNYGQYQYDFDEKKQLTVNQRPVVFYHYSAFVISEKGVFVPIVHKHYPLNREFIQNIYAPYCKALRTAIENVASVLPDCNFGLDLEFDVSDYSYVSYQSIPKGATKQQIKNLEQLDENWNFYLEQSDQEVLVDEHNELILKPEQSLEDFLENKSIASRIETVYFIGCHLFQEQEWFNSSFANLSKLILFEPVPEVEAALRKKMATDNRAEIFPFAVSDEEGMVEFNVANNFQSSSLLPLGEHKKIFPSVNYSGVINVSQVTLKNFIREHGNIIPDLLYIDVQGAEYKVLTGLSSEQLSQIKIIYTEVSLIEMYQGARLLDDVKAFLSGQFIFVGFRDMLNTKVHGDALFINKRLYSEILGQSHQDNLSFNTTVTDLDQDISEILDLFNTGHKRSAILALDGLLDNNANQPELKNIKAEFQYALGQEYITESFKVWQNLIEDFPTDVLYLNNLGVAAWETNRRGLSLAATSKALTLEPGNIAAVANIKEISTTIATEAKQLPSLLSSLDQSHLNNYEVQDRSTGDRSKYDTGSTNSKALISIIVSSYASEAFIAECLDDLVSQTLFSQIEIIVVDANSPENEKDIVKAYQNNYPNIKFIRTRERIGIYSAWNIAIKAASGEFIMPMSTNDRLNSQACENLVNALVKSPDVMLVYGDSYLTSIPHETFENHTRSGMMQWPDYSFEDLLERCLVGPHPMWRKSVHEKVGYFDEQYQAIGDQDFWIRIGEQFELKHIPIITGLFWDTSDSLSGNPEVAEAEIMQIRSKYANRYRLPTISNNSTDHDNLLSQAIAIQKLTGNSLPQVTKQIMQTNQALTEQQKKHVFIALGELLANQLGTNSDLNDTSLSNSLMEVVSLMKELYDANKTDLEYQSHIGNFEQKISNHKYKNWVKAHELLEIDGQLFAERMLLNWKVRPVFHFIMFLFPGEASLLADTIDSLAGQYYKDWRLTIIGEGPEPDAIFTEQEQFNWVSYSGTENPYRLLNSALENTVADWVGLIEAGVRFPFHSMLTFGDYINLNSDWKIIYADEDEIDAQGNRLNPKFKPDFNLDLLRSNPYTGNFSILDKGFLLEIGGYQAVPNLESYDAIFKAYDSYGEKVIGHIAEVLFHKPDVSKRLAEESDIQRVIKRHLDRNAIDAEVDAGYFKNSFRINYKYPYQPKVSIIIPSKDKLEYLGPCVESLFKKTSYSNYEVIIVDNQSKDPDVFKFYSDLQKEYSNQISVIDFNKDFNFSAICNYAADHATGEYLLFLNNDTEVLHVEWLERMMAYAMREDVGVVGARLVYPETGLLQHAGVVMGMNEIADHPYNGHLHLKESGYMGRAQLDQNYSAVTGACLLIDKNIYQIVEGMDECQFAVSYNDVDLCLKVREAGYRVTWTPFATLIHHGSVTQLSSAVTQEKHQRFQNEQAALFKKWQKYIAADPAYNRHLSLVNQDYSIEHAMPCNWDVKFHDRLRILGVPLEGGSGDYRIIQPFDGLSKSGLAQCEHIRLKEDEYRAFSVSEIARQQADVLVLHSVLSDQQLRLLEQCKTLLPELFIIYMMDDLVNQIPEKSSAYKRMKRNFRNAKPRIRKALSFCDRAVVSTQPLADFCQGMIDDIKVVPNSLEKQVWLGLDSKPNQGNKLRIGWAGALQHQGDLEIISEVVRQTANEVDWVFMGLCPDSIKPYIKEFQEPVPMSEYPKKLAGLKLDLAIAPLEDNAFNEAKSNLRLLEYGILGWPVICSNVYPYRGAPVTCVENSTESWLSAIRYAIEKRENLPQQGDKLRQWVLKDYLLEDNLDQWLDALTPKSLQFKADNTFLSNSDKTHSVE